MQAKSFESYGFIADTREKERRKLEREVLNISSSEQLWAFWEKYPNLTLSILCEKTDTGGILDILCAEVDKENDGDINLIIRSWTIRNSVDAAMRAISIAIDSFANRRKVRKIEQFLRPHVDNYSLERAVPTVLSRDYGKTCVRISREAVREAAQELKNSGAVVTAKTVENYLYETLPHEPYMSKAERERLGLR